MAVVFTKFFSFIVFVCLFVVGANANYGSSKHHFSESDPIGATQGLVSRVLGPQFVNQFSYEVLPADPTTGHDVFSLKYLGGKNVLGGNTGVAMATALGYYLKYYCGADFSWGVNGTGNQLNIPSPLPKVLTPYTQVFPSKYRYYMNVCTVGYSMVWWNWTRWEQEIDWMALSGVNFPLSFTGQEYVWYNFYESLGLNDSSILSYFSGAAFLPWFRMGNIQGWGGPLDADWRYAQYELQLQFLNRTRLFGMINALPGFAGHVPPALEQLYPNAQFIHSASWGNFNSTYSATLLLQPTDPLFVPLGTKFYQMIIEEFGTDHVFQMDQFNEMNPSSSDSSYLTAANAAVFNAMRAGDNASIYLMQGWLFRNNPDFWTDQTVEAYLAGVPDSGMIILDLDAAANPIWDKFDNLFGKPFIWCMLHNYGGRRGLYGNLTLVSENPYLAQQQSAGFVGVGITMEAIEQNPVIYELMLETGWRSGPVNVSAWLASYAERRYNGVSASAQSAWGYLFSAAYNQNNEDVSIIEEVPTIGSATSRNTNATGILNAWRMLTRAVNELTATTAPFRYDLVDVARQSLLDLFDDIHTMNEKEYQLYQFNGINSSVAVISTANALLGLIKDLDMLLGSDSNYLLGYWIESAKAWGSTPAEIANKEFNARNQLTMWGYSGQINDYAAKHWNGLVGDYYFTRWQMLMEAEISTVMQGTTFDADTYLAQILAYEQSWSVDTTYYPSYPVGNTVEIASSLLTKYTSTVNNYQVIPGGDIGGGNDIMQAWTQDVAQLKFLCDINPSCLGFNTDGWMKNQASPIISGQACDLYLKQA